MRQNISIKNINVFTMMIERKEQRRKKEGSGEKSKKEKGVKYQVTMHRPARNLTYYICVIINLFVNFSLINICMNYSLFIPFESDLER